MAIIQSILVGKGKGKIGNVVLSGLKGQTVAKQLNSNPSNPRTVAQTENRVKMANAVLAWQFLSNFMRNAKGLRKPLESVYNAFVRGVVSEMSTVLADSRALAAKYALGLDKFSGNWFKVKILGVSNGAINVSLLSDGVVWSPSLRACCIVFDSNTNAEAIIDRSISEVEFNAGTLELDCGKLIPDDSAAVYLYDSASSKITNISFKAV